MQDVAFLYSTDTWRDSVRREMFMTWDRFVAHLSTAPQIGSLLISDALRSWPTQAALHLLGRRHPPLLPRERPQQHVRPFRISRRDPFDREALESAYASLDRQLEKAARTLSMHEPVVIVGSPFAAAYCPFQWASRVVYYAWDDWAESPPLLPWRSSILQAYERISTRGCRVCAVTGAIIERIKPTGESLIVPNGLEPGEWQAIPSPSKWFTDIGAPVALYIGTLDSRLDLELISDVSERIPGWVLLFVGPAVDREIADSLRRIPGVRVQEPVSRREIVGLVGAADCGIIPHRRNLLTRAMSPLKLYEYCAGGLPVVSTTVDGAHGVSDGIRFTDSPASFSALIQESLTRGRAAEADRQQFVASNTWKSRFDAVCDFALSG